jgi:uncharacterized OB-fold protein
VTTATGEDAGAFVRADMVADPAATPGERVALRGSGCPSCRRVEFPALDVCPACGSDVHPVELGPEAILAGFTEVLHPPPGAQVEVPYTVAVAAFEENLAVLGLLDRPTAVAELEVGLPLEVCVVPVGDRLTYGFRLA